MLDEGEYLRGEGAERGINLTSTSEYEAIRDELKENYNLDLQREAIDATKYNQIAVNDYIEKSENVVDIKGTVIESSKYDVTIGAPVADPDIDGMTQYVVNVEGDYPDGAKLYIDLDGTGSGKTLEFSIENGKAIIPADVVDTSEVGNNGVAGFFGRATVGDMNGSKLSVYSAVEGAPLGSTEPLTASFTENGYAFTVVDGEGETVSSFAVNTQGKTISNISEIFNGIDVGESDRLPAGFSAVEGIEDRGTLASGEKMPDVGNYHGGYNSQYDSSINYPFKNNNHSLVGTPMEWDANGDGVMSATEEASYIKQMFVRTATNPYVLGQNASNYGLLEPDTLAKNLFNGDSNAMTETLKAWGVGDGVIDSEKELQSVLDHLKMPENSEYYDKLVNSTIAEMQEQLAGGGFEQGTLTDRISTYINKDGSIDTKGNASVRVALYAYKTDPVTGERIYVGNKGWWVRKYYGMEGGKVADLPLCEQKAIVVEKAPEDENTKAPEDENTLKTEETEDEKLARLGTEEQLKTEETEEEKLARLGTERTVKPKDEENTRKTRLQGTEKTEETEEEKLVRLGTEKTEETEEEKLVRLGTEKTEETEEEKLVRLGTEKTEETEEEKLVRLGTEKTEETEEEKLVRLGTEKTEETEAEKTARIGVEKTLTEEEEKQIKFGTEKTEETEEEKLVRLGTEKTEETEEEKLVRLGTEKTEETEEEKLVRLGTEKTEETEEEKLVRLGTEKSLTEEEEKQLEFGTEKNLTEEEEKQIEFGTEKTGDMHAGDNVKPMGPTETDPDETYVEASPDNHVDPSEKPGDPIGAPDEEVYRPDAVLGEDGEPLRDSEGEMYITDPTGTETEEEIMENIEDGTQTTYTTDTTDYNPDAQDSLASDYLQTEGGAVDSDGNPLPGSGVIEEEEVPDLSNPDSVGDTSQVYSDDEMDEINKLFGGGTSNNATPTPTVSDTTPAPDTVAPDTTSIPETPTTPASTVANPESVGTPDKVFSDEEEEELFNLFR
jgi:hypothetical protein